MKRPWAYEIPVFYLLLFGIERAFLPGRPAFLGIEPHPFWLGVLVFGLRYGLPAGVCAGLTGAGLFLAESWTLGDRFRFEDADFYLLPGLFTAVGAVLGATTDRLRRRAREHREEADSLRRRVEELVSEIGVLKGAARAVEQQVVSQMSTLVTTYEGARRLGTLERKALLEGILEFFSAALKAEKAAVHLLKKDRWVLFAQRGWREEDRYPRELEFSRGVIGKAGSENRVASLRDWKTAEPEKAWEARGNADAVMAAPLRTDDGRVIGVFSVQDLPLLKFNSAGVNLLTLLADWAETAISKSLYFEELRSKLIQDEVYGVYNEKYFQSRSRQEFGRSKTYALPFSILLVAVDGLRTLPPEGQVNALRVLGRLLQETSREIDIVTRFPDPGVPFAVMMMTASAESAGEFREAVLGAVGKLGVFSAEGRGLSLRIGVGSYRPEMNSVEEIVARARAALG